jgi:DNA-directed RNA polymerase specialized sigma24 family protein
MPDTGPDAPDPEKLLLLTFEAFRATHRQEWLRYARLRAGSPAAAVQVVEATCDHLAANWPYALQQPSVAAYAWALLKKHLAARGQGRLYATVARLPERQYDVMVLRYALGYQDKQVARLLGLRENTVRSLVRLATRHLTAEVGTD